MRKQYLTFLGRKIFAMLVQHARYKLSEVGSCNFRWNDRYNGAEIFLLGSIRVCVCASLSLSLFIGIWRQDLYRLLEVMDWISGRNCIESSYVFNFKRKRNEDCVYSEF